MASIKKVLNQYRLNSDMQFYEKITDNIKADALDKACEMFLLLPKKNRVAFVNAATVGAWGSGISEQKLHSLFDFILV